MSLTLHHHPLASFCHKVLIALYENSTPFRGAIVDYGDEKSRTEFFALWPLGKIPVLRDERLGHTLPETTIIIEYLDQHYPGAQPLLPLDEALRLETRLWDRFFDFYIHAPMQKIVSDHRRADGGKDPLGVDEARAMLRTAYAMLDRRMADKTWVIGDAFSMADCAAAPALFYAGIVAPFSGAYPNVAAYFDRLTERRSFRRTLAEARPYFHLYPFAADIPAHLLIDDAAAAP
ncbi:MAG TPA: glutathione S-transferase family protein [Aliidongia sp.]|uniref:glutathione S-transferase family protein n=1 Tax=Aliidongia sp. TaxID=1914230 RepID=UPI002DDCBA09|nr:glutathione S-transferase family protein [Aliidongia sp.]HEV2678677.1 glutathione S-transferase family protein [Aliidongia sp.]